MYITDGHGPAAWGSVISYAHDKVPIQQKDRNGGSSGYCLDAGMNSSGAATMLNTCNGSDNQLWNIYTNGVLQNTRTGLCLTNSGSGSTNGGTITVFRCTQSPNQIWELNSDGTIRNPSAGKCLDNITQQLVVGNKIQAWDCVNAWSEKWWIGGIP
jgi:hypothetical protein